VYAGPKHFYKHFTNSNPARLTSLLWPRVHNSPGAESLRRASKSSNNVTITFFNRVHLLPKALMFEHGGAKLASCLGRHLTFLCPWLWQATTSTKLNGLWVWCPVRQGVAWKIVHVEVPVNVHQPEWVLAKHPVLVVKKVPQCAGLQMFFFVECLWVGQLQN